MGSIFSIFNFVEERRKPLKSGGFSLYRPNRTTFWPRQNLSLRSTWSSRSTQRWRTWPERWANRFGCCFRMLRIGVGCFRGNTHIGIPRQHFFGNRPPATGVRQFKKSPKSSRIFAEKAPNSLLVRELEIFCCCKKYLKYLQRLPMLYASKWQRLCHIREHGRRPRKRSSSMDAKRQRELSYDNQHQYIGSQGFAPFG